MANTLDILRTRLRSTGTTAISDAFGYQVISIVQRTLNARFGRVVASSSITLDANTCVFDIRTKMAAATNLLSMKVSNRTIHRLDSWKELAQYDRSWYSTTGSRHEAWTQIGKDLFAVYPTVTSNVTATVYYAKLVTAIDEAADSFEIPTEDEDILYTLCELIFHLHLRNYAEAKESMTAIQSMISTQFPDVIPPKETRHD